MEESLFIKIFISWAPYTVYWLIWFIVPGIVSAYYVYQDGIKRMPLALNIQPKWWALFCFASGAWAILAYWLMHHSNLTKKEYPVINIDRDEG